MKRVFEATRYLVVIASLALLLAAAGTFVAGAVVTVQTFVETLSGPLDLTAILISVIKLMDLFLVATALLIFAMGLYELFVTDLDLPGWLLIRNLYDLKAKLSSVVILVLSIKFLEKLLAWKDPLDTLLFGVAITLVSGMLIAFSHYSHGD